MNWFPKPLILLITAAATGAFAVEVSSKYTIGVFAGVALLGLLMSLDAIFNGKPEREPKAAVMGDCGEEI